MNDIPRQQLRKIIERYGTALGDDPRRTRALLMDYCGEYRGEIFVLVSAQEERIPADLLSNSAGVPMLLQVTRLTRRLVDNRAIDAHAARWAVVSWAYALGIEIGGLESPATEQSEAPAIPPILPSIHNPPATPASRVKGSYLKGLYTSEWAVDLYGRPRSTDLDRWDKLGATPGQVRVPPEIQVKLVPHIAAKDIPVWLEELNRSNDFVAIDLQDPVDDGVVSALCALPALSAVQFTDASALTDTGSSAITCLRRLTMLSLSNATQLTDAALQHVGTLTALQAFALSWSTVTDEAMRALSGLKALSSLTLRECWSLTGMGTRYLGGIAHLYSLDFSGGRNVTAINLEPLKHVRSLRRLILANCGAVSADILDTLLPLIHLNYVDISRNDHIDDRAVAKLRSYPELTTVVLARTLVTNNGIRLLRDVSRLHNLDLEGCEGIDDRSIRNIIQMQNLGYINLGRCPHISKRGLRRLRDARPDLYIAAAGISLNV